MKNGPFRRLVSLSPFDGEKMVAALRRVPALLVDIRTDAELRSRSGAFASALRLRAESGREM